jgi:PHD/YefM family antitoxin component YafN of YafNO toxin-antitoxin module
MPHTVTSEDFNQDISGAKRLADKGPVVITDRGKAAYVFMTHDAYQRLKNRKPSILELLANFADKDIAFKPLRLK